MNNPNSFWAPYLGMLSVLSLCGFCSNLYISHSDTLPSFVAMPDTWTDEERELVKGTLFYDLIQYTKNSITQKYEEYFRPFNEVKKRNASTDYL
jgi:hypothetical protein